MKWTEEKIRALSSKDYLLYRDEIREFYEPERKIYFDRIAKELKIINDRKEKELIKLAKLLFLTEQKKLAKSPLSYYQKRKLKLVQKQVREKNKFKNNHMAKIRRRIRYYSDPNFQLACNLRTRLLSALKGKTKSKRTLELLGCSIDFLRKHLEKQFKRGMTWDNHSVHGWHIDHIKPCAKFDLSKPEEQAKCFNYTNLQPLWAKNNLKKNKY